MRIHKNLYVAVLFLVVSFICMLFLTTASPLYSVNPSPDGNTMFTVGKGLLHGLMPYKDLFDQRGPLIYLMNSVAALISYKTFFGIYIFESIAMFLDLFFIYKILNLKYNKQISIISTFIVIPLMFTSKFLSYGNLPEEYVLSLILFTIYLFTRKSFIEWGKYEYIIIGLFTSISFWIKYTLSITWLSMYLVFIIYFIYHKDLKKLFRSIVYGFIGFAPISIFIIILYCLKHSLHDLFYVYFYLNMTAYGTNTSLVTVQYFVLIAVISIIFLIVYAKTYKEVTVSKYLLFAIVLFNYLVMIKIAFMPYYLEIMAFIFIVLPIVVCQLLSKYNFLRKVMYIIPVICFVGMFITNKSFVSYSQYVHKNNPYIDITGKSNIPVFKEFSSIINKSNDKTVLNYRRLDQGIYTYSGLLPSNKYFMVGNLNYAPMIKSQKHSLKSKNYKFIFIGYTKYPTNIYDYKLDKQELNVLTKDYKIVKSRDGLFETHPEKYVLYERK